MTANGCLYFVWACGLLLLIIGGVPIAVSRISRPRWHIEFPVRFPETVKEEKWGEMGKKGRDWGKLGGTWGKLGRMGTPQWRVVRDCGGGRKFWGNLGKIKNEKHATSPRCPRVVWVGTRGACYPLNHRWGYHPIPMTLQQDIITLHKIRL